MGGGEAVKMGGGNNILIPTKGFPIFSNGIVGRKAKNKQLLLHCGGGQNSTSLAGY
jgi:hypothetical protein